MANFFKDNPDLRRRVAAAPWGAVLPALERDFADPHELAPRNLAEAVEQIGLVLEMVGELAAEEIFPHAAQVDREGARLVDGAVVYPEPMQRGFRLLAEAGLLGFCLPRAHGGMNLPTTAYTAAVEIVARADASLMTVFALQGCGETIHRFASEEIQARYLPRLCVGEITPCMALTEPNAGSALGSVATRAIPGANGQWRIRGSKIFITNGGADILLTLARSEEDKQGGAGLSLFLVERGEGVEVAKLEEKLGIHGSATALINFDDAPGLLIGPRGAGLYKVTMDMLHNVRLEVSAQAVGIAQAAQVAAASYARERQQFGRSIDRFAPVRAMLFDNALQIETARALVFTTAAVVDRRRGLDRAGGGDELARYDRIADLMSPLTKYYACEMVNEVANRALQVHGGYGYVREYPVERHLRDGRITNIYEGTSEIQVGALIEPLLQDGLPLLFEEPLRDAPEPECCPDVLGILRANYETLLQAAEMAGDADRLARQGWARGFADSTVDLLAAIVFLRDAAHDERSARLARHQALQGRRRAEAILRTVTEGDRARFADDSFEDVVGPYRSDG
ncbi:MAG: acyl-CoA dehydrogenase family protein [Planctomycetota bacterium]